MKYRKVYVYLFLGILTLFAFAFIENSEKTLNHTSQQILYQDVVYDDLIKTIRFYPGTPDIPEPLKSAYPILYLNDNTPITLEFDELVDPSENEAYFLTDLINCDANWEPTNVLPIEFYEGFSQKQITQWRRSEFTNVSYIHYTFTFPFENEFIKQSGNYILKVYRNNGNNDLVLTRRFIVVNPKLDINITNILNANRLERERLRTLNFQIVARNLDRINPSTDLKVMLLQNFRWDNAATFSQPRFFGNNTFEYFVDLNDEFKGGNEFRLHDIRSVRLFSQSVEDIELINGIYHARLFTDNKRLRNEFTPIMDRNGTYFIEVQEQQFPAFQADYIWNLFRIESPKVKNGEVYVFGSFTDWNLLPSHKMEYNEAANRYEADILLKQGVYDYIYVLGKDNTTTDDAYFEGRHIETENFYNILVYYRRPGDRTDQLIGFLPVNYYE